MDIHKICTEGYPLHILRYLMDVHFKSTIIWTRFERLARAAQDFAFIKYFPTLGAGARLNKHKKSDDSNKSNWRDRDSQGGDSSAVEWNNKPKTGVAVWSEKKSSKPNKGWEHDDRFQTDYS